MPTALTIYVYRSACISLLRNQYSGSSSVLRAHHDFLSTVETPVLKSGSSILPERSTLRRNSPIILVFLVQQVVHALSADAFEQVVVGSSMEVVHRLHLHVGLFTSLCPMWGIAQLQGEVGNGA